LTGQRNGVGSANTAWEQGQHGDEDENNEFVCTGHSQHPHTPATNTLPPARQQLTKSVAAASVTNSPPAATPPRAIDFSHDVVAVFEHRHTCDDSAAAAASLNYTAFDDVPWGWALPDSHQSHDKTHAHGTSSASFDNTHEIRNSGCVLQLQDGRRWSSSTSQLLLYVAASFALE
jgi:hypothetical protein